MFRKRDDRTVARDAEEAYMEDRARDERSDERRPYPADEASDRRSADNRRYVEDEAPDRRSEYKRQLMRAVMTLLGAAVAGVLIWLATQIGDDSTGGYWAEYAVLAAAGLTLALSQLLGGWTKWGLPKLSIAVFLLGFLPVLVAGGWLLVAHQPEGASFRSDVLGWSNDIGIDWLVDDFREYLPVIAFAIGLVFGFSFDTKGPRVRRARSVERDRDVRTAPVDDREAADEPLTAERRTVATPSERHLGDGTTTDDDRIVTRQGTTTTRRDD